MDNKSVVNRSCNDDKEKLVSLIETFVGQTYELIASDTQRRTRHKLETLGLVPGELIKVIQKTGAGVIIDVKHSRLALAQNLCKQIQVLPIEGRA